MNHFTAIGIPLHEDAAAGAFLESLLESAVHAESSVPGYSYLHWKGGQGSELWFHVNETTNALASVTPAFRGKTSLTLGLVATIGSELGHTPLDDSLEAWANPQPDDPLDGDYPLVFTWLDKGLHPPLPFPVRARVQITAFAHELLAYASEAAFAEAMQEEGGKAGKMAPLGMAVRKWRWQPNTLPLQGCLSTTVSRCSRWR